MVLPMTVKLCEINQVFIDMVKRLLREQSTMMMVVKRNQYLFFRLKNNRFVPY